MKILVSASKLTKALNNVSRIAIGRASLPILNNVLIRVDDKKVSLTTTNLDMAIVDFLPVLSSEDGVITVPAKLLTEFISNLPRDEKVEIRDDNQKILITAGKYSSVINGAPADDFPELPELNKEAITLKLGIDDFKLGISQVIFAASSDTTRPGLTGVYFNTNYDNTLAIVATDGYRFAERKLLPDVKDSLEALVPAPSLQEVLRSIPDDVEEIEISFDQDLVRFRLGEIEIISRLIDATFPKDYHKLIPKDSSIKLHLDREELIRTLKLASVFARPVGGSIHCEAVIPDTFTIKSIASEFGENTSELKTVVEKAGKVNFSARYLLDVLNILEEPTIELAFSNQTSPLVVKNQKSNNYYHVIMPLNS